MKHLKYLALKVSMISGTYRQLLAQAFRHCLSVPVLIDLHNSAIAQARACRYFFLDIFLRLMDVCFHLLNAT